MIYSYIFGDNKWTFTGWTTPRNSAKESDLALLLTSRQLHTETALLPYMLGRFHFRLMYMGVEAGEIRVDDFLEERSEEQLAAIGSLALQSYDNDRDQPVYVRGTGEYWAEKLAWVQDIWLSALPFAKCPLFLF